MSTRTPHSGPGVRLLRGGGRLGAVGLLVAGCIGTAVTATLPGRILGWIRGDRTATGYLALAGVPPLRWAEPPPAPAPLPAVMSTLYAPPSAAADPAPAAPGSAAAPTTPAGRPKPSAVEAKDLLPFFERKNGELPPPADPGEGLRFLPAQPPLPASSAEFHTQ